MTLPIRLLRRSGLTSATFYSAPTCFVAFIEIVNVLRLCHTISPYQVKMTPMTRFPLLHKDLEKVKNIEIIIDF